MNRILEVFEISKRYGTSTAVDGFSLGVEGGRINGLLGPNGSGKTTSLHIIAGLVRSDCGTVRVCGEPIENKASRSFMGFAPDDLPLPGSLTGREYLEFHDAMRRRRDREQAALLIHAFGLEEALENPVGQYSHGMRRKIQLIAALSHTPELLLLDEPYRGLDPDAAAVLRSLLRSFAASGRAVVVATHDMLRAERDCDHVTILSCGVTVAAGSPDELIRLDPTASNLEELFLGVTGLAEQSRSRRESIESLFTLNQTETVRKLQ